LAFIQLQRQQANFITSNVETPQASMVDNINQSVPKKVEIRDITIGFFGWVLLSNIIFLILTFLVAWNGSNEVLFSGIFWLLTIIAILVLFALKRVWVCTGVTAAVIINIVLWGMLLFLLGFRTPVNMFGNLLVFSGFPLPSGLWILLLGFA